MLSLTQKMTMTENEVRKIQKGDEIANSDKVICNWNRLPKDSFWRI